MIIESNLFIPLMQHQRVSKILLSKAAVEQDLFEARDMILQELRSSDEVSAREIIGELESLIRDGPFNYFSLEVAGEIIDNWNGQSLLRGDDLLNALSYHLCSYRMIGGSRWFIVFVMNKYPEVLKSAFPFGLSVLFSDEREGGSAKELILSTSIVRAWNIMLGTGPDESRTYILKQAVSNGVEIRQRFIRDLIWALNVLLHVQPPQSLTENALKPLRFIIAHGEDEDIRYILNSLETSERDVREERAKMVIRGIRDSLN